MEKSSFCMPIHEIFHIRERGLVVTGRIEKGEVSIGDVVYFETANGQLIKDNIILDGLEIFGRITTANEGMNIGLFFKIPYVKSKDEALSVLPLQIGDIVRK